MTVSRTSWQRLWKIRKRISWCLSLMCVASLFVFGFAYFVGFRSRVDASKIFATQSPEIALPLLEQCVDREPGNANAWLLLAKTREKVVAPLQAHLKDAARAYQKAFELDERSEQACVGLAHLQMILGDTTAAYRFARRAVQINPSCETAWCILVQTEIANASLTELKDFVSKWSESNSWKIQLAIQDARLALGHTPNQVACKSPQPTGSQSADQFLTARLHWLAGENDDALASIKRSIESGPCDRELMRGIVRLCSNMQVDGIGIQLLEDVDGCLDDPYLALWYARRKWQSNELQMLVDAIHTGKARSFACEPETNFLLWLAYRRLGDSVRTKRLMQQLRGQAQSTESTKRWHHLIESMGSDKPVGDASMSRAIAAVLEVSPSSPMIRLIQASQFYRIGEYHLAARLSGDAILLAPNWYQLLHLHATSLALSGQQDEALRVSEQMLTKFPKRFDAHLLRQLLVGARTQRMESARRKLVGEWASQIELPAADPRRESLALLGDFSKAAPANASDLEWKKAADQYSSQLQQVLITNYYLVASRLGGTASISLSPETTTSKRGALRKTAELMPQEFKTKMPKLFQQVYKSADLDIIEDLKQVSAEGAISWRILAARKLLMAKTPKNAALAIDTLRSVTDKLTNHPDANLLMGLAYLQLSDVNTAMEHWYVASNADWRLAEQCLRLSLSARADGLWEDAHSLVLFWNNVAASIFQPRGLKSRASDQATNYLLILAAYAENKGDDSIAEQAYRRLLLHDSSMPIPLNNLAFLLFRNGGSLEEAILLSNKALESQPKNPDFIDTNCQIAQALADRKNQLTQ